MTQYQVLPPQPEPKHRTVRHQPETLGEHLRAFLNANNMGGFEEDSPDDAETVTSVLVSVINEPYLNLTQVREIGFKIKRLTNKMIPYNRSLHLIARLYGYEGWKEAKDAGGGDGIINRLRDPRKSLEALRETGNQPIAKGRRRERDAIDIADMIQRLESIETLSDDPEQVLDHYDPNLHNYAALLGELSQVTQTLVLASMTDSNRVLMITALRQHGVDIQFAVKTKGYVQTRKGRVLFGQHNWWR